MASASARAIAQIAMVKIGQGAIAELSLHLVRQILVLPLRAFETIDSSALLSALTDDIALIANAMVGLPHLCINIPIVIACLVYTGWLAPRSMACGVVFAALAIIAYVMVSSRGMKALRQARERQALLVGHFRTLIGGFRELKVHRGRRDAYIAESLEPTMVSARAHMIGGMAHFAAAEGWGQVAYLRLHRLPPLRRTFDRANVAANARLGRLGRPLSDDPSGHHLDVGPRPGPGAGLASEGPGADPHASSGTETTSTAGRRRSSGS